MTFFKRLAIAAIAATALLALVGGTAAALRSIEINEKSIHLRFAELSFIEVGSGLSFICPVTLRIVLNETKLSKRATEIGNVTEVRFAEALCRGGTFRALAERLPWVVLYNGFTGTLPRILTIRFIIRRFALLLQQPIGGECLYEGDFAFIANVGERGEINAVEDEAERALPLAVVLAGSCPRTLRSGGIATVIRLRDLLGGVTVRLI